MKYFGTDGIRGVFGVDITEQLAYRVGLAVVGALGGGDYVIGRDTRRSGECLLNALARGITDAGANAVTLGVVTTPAVSYFTQRLNASGGIMISASHNSSEYNGIKVFLSGGIKADGAVEQKIERLIESAPRSKQRGKITREPCAGEQYVSMLVSYAESRLNGVEVCLDSGFGSVGELAGEAFRALGAKTRCYNFTGEGDKINSGVGALYPSFIEAESKKHGCRLGFAFDGDGDRVSVVSSGSLLDGDSVAYNLFDKRKRQMPVVGTVLSNVALEQAVKESGAEFLRSEVGDKHVSKLMRRHNAQLGAEPSGHYLIEGKSATGDGLLTAICFACLAQKAESFPVRLSLAPQITRSLRLIRPWAQIESAFIGCVSKVKQRLGDRVRVIVRPSGTEPRVRVTVEGQDGALVEEIMSELCALYYSVVGE